MLRSSQKATKPAWNAPDRPGKVYAITSGKGGVGKTSLAVNLSITLSRAGLNVLLVDADMGLANVDLMAGISATHTVEQVIAGEASIFDALVTGPENITILPAGSGLGRVHDLAEDDAMRFREELLKLQQAFDVVFIDTGAGISANVTDFVFMADEVIIVMTPEPTAFADAYAMAKVIFLNRADATVGVVVNMVRNGKDAGRIVEKFNDIVKNFLKKEVVFHGAIGMDKVVSEAIMRQVPLALYAKSSGAMDAIRGIARSLLGIEPPQPKSLFRR